MADIFISYKREDRDRIMPLAQVLEGYGYTVWWDMELVPSQKFERQIKRELDAARCVIVVWTDKSIDIDGMYVSEWVQIEANSGDQRGVLLPVQLDAERTHWRHGQNQFAVLHDWDGNETAAGLQYLLKGVELHAGSRARPQDLELASWQAAERAEVAEQFKRFAEAFPQSRFAEIARSRHAELEELSAWQALGLAPTIETLAAFLQLFPTGRFADDAKARIRVKELAGPRVPTVSSHIPQNTSSATAKAPPPKLDGRMETISSTVIDARQNASKSNRVKVSGSVSRRQVVLGAVATGVVTSGIIVALTNGKKVSELANNSDSSPVNSSPEPQLGQDAPLAEENTSKENDDVEPSSPPRQNLRSSLVADEIARVPDVRLYNSDALATSPNLEWFALTAGGETEIWQTMSVQKKWPKTGGSGKDYALAFSTDSKTLFIGGFRTLRAIRLSDGQRIWSIRRPDDWWDIWSIAQSPSTRELAVTGNLEKLTVLSSASGAVLRELTGHSQYVGRCVFSGDGSRLFSGPDESGQIICWDTNTYRQVRVIQSTPGRWLELTPDSEFLISAHEDGQIRVWSTLNGTLEQEFSVGLSTYVTSLCGARQTTLFVQDYTASNVKFYNWRTGALLGEAEIGAQYHNFPAAFRDDRILAGNPLGIWRMKV